MNSNKVLFDSIPKGRLAIWVVVITELVIFGGALVVFALYFTTYKEAFYQNSSLMDIRYGIFNTIILLSSSFCMVLAHKYAVLKDKVKTIYMMLATVSLGTVFFAVKMIEWSHKISKGLVINITTPYLVDIMGPGIIFWSFYYLLTGLHALHVIAGLISIIIIIFTDIRFGRNFHRVEMAGIYWHFVDIVWIFLFSLFYMITI